MINLVLYNPHVDDFIGTPPHFKLLRRRGLKKYGFLIDAEFLGNDTVTLFYDGTISAFMPDDIFKRVPKVVRMLISRIEIIWWKKINRVNGSKFIITSDASQITNKIIIAFSYKSAVGNWNARREVFLSSRFTIMHLSHYFIRTKEKSENLRSLPNILLAGDSDIESNWYFKKFFSWYQKKIVVLPFAVQSRFKNEYPVNNRQNKCVATGSFHQLQLEYPQEHFQDYRNATKLNCYHPVRENIYNHRLNIKNIIDSYVVPYRNYGKKNGLIEKIKKIFVSQKSYFKTDINLLYNQYKYSVVGEEVVGFPGIGAFEAMACGCVLIGQENCYRGLGLESGVHYIEYDGTIENLKSIVEKTADNKVEIISCAGFEYIKKNFSYKHIRSWWQEKISAAIE